MNRRSFHRCRAFARYSIGLVVAVAVAHTADGYEPARSEPTAFHGFSQPWESIEVAVAEAGRIADVVVGEGDTVRTGDLIARLDNDVLKASLQVARQRASAGGEEASARARLNHAARRRDDIAKLLEESHASQTELDQAELALREAEAALLVVQERRDIAVADVARIEAELALREVRSPIDGVVIQLNRRKGEYAGAANHVVAKVAVLEQLRLRIHLPTRLAMHLTRESQVKVEFPEIDSRVTGRIDFVSPVTDSPSGTVRVDIRIDNPSGKLRSGLLGVWRISANTQPKPQSQSHPTRQASRRNLTQAMETRNERE